MNLINFLQPKLDRTDYPTYRASGWQIGTGMIESTAKQLVGERLKGPGMHWQPQGATVSGAPLATERYAASTSACAASASAKPGDAGCFSRTERVNARAAGYR